MATAPLGTFTAPSVSIDQLRRRAHRLQTHTPEALRRLADARQQLAALPHVPHFWSRRSFNRFTDRPIAIADLMRVLEGAVRTRSTRGRVRVDA